MFCHDVTGFVLAPIPILFDALNTQICQPFSFAAGLGAGWFARTEQKGC